MKIETSTIRFAPDILRRLGEELNPSFDQGVIEVVKNSYDADASTCTVTLETRGDGEWLTITDDGEGMSAQEILDGWLVLGSSSKRTDDLTPRFHRTPVGNKGLGRLAALRMGETASVDSISRRSRTRSKVEIHWAKFDRADTVDAVPLEVYTTDVDEAGCGTTITIGPLIQPASRVEVKKLSRAMLLLADPFRFEAGSFSSRLIAPGHPDLAERVDQGYFRDAEYVLEASSQNGRYQFTATDWAGQNLWTASHDDVSVLTDREYFSLPDLNFKMWIYVLSADNFALRRSELTGVRRWLREYGGVHVYWNDIRVSPYGNPGNDWLDLNLLRSKNPEFRPSTNTSIGRLLIADSSGALRQKTDRSGFVETEEFQHVRLFCQEASEWLARQRLGERENKRAESRGKSISRTESTRQQVLTQIETLNTAQKKNFTEAFSRFESAAEDEAADLRREIQLYRTLATAGITTAMFSHEVSGNALKRINIIQGILKRCIEQKPIPTDRAKKAVSDLGEAAKSLAFLSNSALELIQTDKRRLQRVELDGVVVKIVDSFKPHLDMRAVGLELALDGSPGAARCSHAAIESVVVNLLNNALAALESENVDERKILIRTSITTDERWRLTVSDNGPGISGSIKEIWLPGVSTRVDGTGLGLTIVRDSILELGGSATAEAHGPLGGANFEVYIPILK